MKTFHHTGLALFFGALCSLCVLGLFWGATHLPRAQAAAQASISPGEDDIDWPEITLTVVRDGLAFSTFGTWAPNDPSRFYLVKRSELIYVRHDETWLDTPFLDIRDRVEANLSECGLLGLAFAPDFSEENPVFYVVYSANENLIGPPPGSNEQDNGCDTVVARFSVSEDPNIAQPASEEQVLLINQPRNNHNTSALAFGPDEMLYIATGDGGGANNIDGPSLRLDSLLGKILRIDVSNSPTYTVPADNPFVDEPQARPEIWALGLRNPFRIAFDPFTGDLYIADVGERTWEEINVQPADSPGGEHYGWPIVEGPDCNLQSPCDLESYVAPVHVYPHQGGGCSGSVIGGKVYRGPQTSLQGIYLFGDYCTGHLYALQKIDGEWHATTLLETELSLISFAEDFAGNLYLLANDISQPEGIGLLLQIEALEPDDEEPGDEEPGDEEPGDEEPGDEEPGDHQLFIPTLNLGP